MAESSLTPDMPDILTEAPPIPVRSKSLGFQLLFGLANIVIGLTSLTIYQAILPGQVAFLDAANKINLLALISSLGALGAVIANPLAGALSDRTTSRWGRRRPWILFGAVVAMIALVILATATSIVQLAIGGILIQIAMNIVLAALTAVIPDQVPMRQRATVSAFAGMAPLVGGVVGLILITQVVRDIQASYYALAVISFVLLALFVLALRDAPLSREAVPPLHLRTFLATFWVNPVRYPDFGYTFLGRLLVFTGYTTTVMYTFFFLQDAVKYTTIFPGQTVTQGVAIFQTIVVVCLVITGILGGIISDRVQRRKPFLIGASVVMTVALLLLAFFPSWSVVLVAAAILGIGFGIYLAVNLALATQVLPTVRDSGKDLGIINTAIFIPLIIAPLIAAVTLDTFHSYTALFLVAALSTLLASALILPIKGVR